ncbi:MAG: alpha/beta hydrolase [Bdellovibrionales bacterium]|nr:alpha/beta hydrolase [Ramlibacter sp.]
MATKSPASNHDLKPPNLALLALECRAPWEFGSLLLSWPLLARAPAGDGHSVIIFPGFSASDVTTVPLRKYLDHLGYRSEGWSQGFNFGPRAGVLELAREQLLKAFKTSGKKVSLIGWSLGGVYARELAKELPQMVRGVITLGSPFAGPARSTNAWRLYELASGRNIEREAEKYNLTEAPLVPTTSLYSRSDGIVAWQGSIQAPSAGNPHTENVEVIASHVGLGLNPSAWWVVADRLVQRQGGWKPFERKKGLHGLIFPDPQR